MYRILIVEDDSDISELLRVWLSEAGYQTVEAGGRPEGPGGL